MKIVSFIKDNWKFLIVVIFMVFITHKFVQIDKTLRSINSNVRSMEGDVSSIEAR